MPEPPRMSRDDGPRRAMLGGVLTPPLEPLHHGAGRAGAGRLTPSRSQAQRRAGPRDLGTDAPLVGAFDTSLDSAAISNPLTIQPGHLRLRSRTIFSRARTVHPHATARYLGSLQLLPRSRQGT